MTQEFNWEMISAGAALLTLIASIWILVTNPYKKHFGFLKELQDPESTLNYMELTKKVELLYGHYQQNNSPLAEKLQAKIDKLEEEKERREKDALSEVRKAISHLQKDFNDFKTLNQK